MERVKNLGYVLGQLVLFGLAWGLVKLIAVMGHGGH